MSARKKAAPAQALDEVSIRVPGFGGYDFCVTYTAGKPSQVAMMCGREVVSVWRAETIDSDGIAQAVIKRAGAFLAQFRLPAVAS